MLIKCWRSFMLLGVAGLNGLQSVCWESDFYAAELVRCGFSRQVPVFENQGLNLKPAGDRLAGNIRHAAQLHHHCVAPQQFATE